MGFLAVSTPQRWRPTRNSTGEMKAIMVVPDEVDDDGTILSYRVWPDGCPEMDGHTKTWKAETLRVYFEPEKE